MVPPAKSLINGIRAIGYSFSTAVADIIDNSISASAKNIEIYSDPLDDPYFLILDDGVGMSEDELRNAMLFGSNRSDKVETPDDLGRFGLGLKSASLSQCKKFIVISKKANEINAMSYDLDIIEKQDKWALTVYDKDEIGQFELVNELMKQDSGTIVIWKNFDRVLSNTRNFEESFRNLVSEAKKHVELVFHRFYNKVNIFFNCKRIEKRDPFLISSPKTQKGRENIIYLKNSKIIVIPHTLPNANSLTNEEKSLLGNPKSLQDGQGFYIYRNERLIVWGTWLHMVYRNDVSNLARVQVDVPSTLDSMWMLDVKKSTAKIPDIIKEQIRISIQDSVIRSKRCNRYKGHKEEQLLDPIWERIDLQNKAVEYKINRKNPFYCAIKEKLNDNDKELFEAFVSQIENYLPQGRIKNDNYDEIRIDNSGDNKSDIDKISELRNLLKSIAKEARISVLEHLLDGEAYNSLKGREAEILEDN